MEALKADMVAAKEAVCSKNNEKRTAEAIPAAETHHAEVRKKSEETGWVMVSIATIAGAALLSFLWNCQDNTPKLSSHQVAVVTGTSSVVPAAPQRSLFDME